MATDTVCKQPDDRSLCAVCGRRHFIGEPNTVTTDTVCKPSTLLDRAREAWEESRAEDARYYLEDEEGRTHKHLDKLLRVLEIGKEDVSIVRIFHPAEGYARAFVSVDGLCFHCDEEDADWNLARVCPECSHLIEYYPTLHNLCDLYRVHQGYRLVDPQTYWMHTPSCSYYAAGSSDA